MSLQDIASRLFMLPEFHYGIVSIKETIYREHKLYTIKDYTKYLLYNILNYRKTNLHIFVCADSFDYLCIERTEKSKRLIFLCTQQQ